MAYRIPRRRAPVVDVFPALCASKTPQKVLDFTKLSFEEEVPVVPELRVQPGWVRLSRQNGKIIMETHYVHPEPSLGTLMSKEILRMKARWVKFYTDRGLEPYDYDYVPPEPSDDYISEDESSMGEDPEEEDME